MVKIIAITVLCLFSAATLSSVRADTPLELSMKRMGKAYKQLTLDLKQPSDVNKADYVALATTLKTEAQTSRGLVPKKAAALPPDQQATMVAAYQKSMDDLSASIDTLTQALQNSQWDVANKQLTTIKEQMFAGHKEFRSKGNKAPTTNTPAPVPTAAPTVQ